MPYFDLPYILPLVVIAGRLVDEGHRDEDVVYVSLTPSVPPRPTPATAPRPSPFPT